MKLTNVNFLAKANAKINKNEKGIKIVSALLVISISLISAFSITVTKAVNEYKEDYRARTLQVDPIFGPLDENTVNKIRNTEHVESIFPLKGIRNDSFNCIFCIVRNCRTVYVRQEQHKQTNRRTCFVSLTRLQV